MSAERKEFDLRTDIRDPLTGEIKTKQPYRLHQKGPNTTFERDGKFYYANGEEILTPDEVRKRKELEAKKLELEARVQERVKLNDEKRAKEEEAMRQLLAEDELKAREEELKASEDAKKQKEIEEEKKAFEESLNVSKDAAIRKELNKRGKGNARTI